MSAPTRNLDRSPSATSEPNEPSHLWHIAADDINEYRAEMGMSWLTACGEFRPPARAEKWSLNDEPDDCLVCSEMELADLDTT